MVYEPVHSVREWGRRGGGFVKRLGEIIGMRGLVASADEQQIPPLRFAPVGMTTKETASLRSG